MQPYCWTPDIAQSETPRASVLHRCSAPFLLAAAAAFCLKARGGCITVCFYALQSAKYLH
jgi:hypothetical protein